MAKSGASRKRISKTNTTKKPSEKKTAAAKPHMRREVKLFICGFLLLVFILSFYTAIFSRFGNFVKNFVLLFLGYTGYLMPAYLTIMYLHSLIKGTLKPYVKVYVCSALSLVLLSAILTINASGGDTAYLDSGIIILATNGIEGIDGGLFGALGIPFMALFGQIGSIIIIVFLIVILMAASTKFAPIIWAYSVASRFISFIAARYSESRERAAERKAEREAEEETAEEPETVNLPLQTELDVQDDTPPRRKRKSRVGKKIKSALTTMLIPPPDEETSKEETSEVKSSDPEISIFIPNEPDKKQIDNSPFRIFSIEDEPPTEPEKTPEQPQETPETPPSPKKKEPNKAIELNEDELLTDTPPYIFPPLDLLERGDKRGDSVNAASLREQAAKLISTLKSFGVDAKILEVSKGPTVTRFEIQPSVGVKVSKITNLADDIALNLAALSVRIEAPIPGKAAVGIEIPNNGNSVVRLREVIDSKEFTSFSAKTAFAVGKDITGHPVVADIAKMPHVLIAGATGSGKSVCINSLIASIIYKADPKEVKLIMIDPKVVELSVYNGIPHLLIPVVTDPRKAAGALNWAVQEMTKRYNLFADSNVRDIKSYNELAAIQGEEPLPSIIIIVDELADLMMVAPRDVEDAVCRLAQLARAAGMHLVVATQRPSVDVITGLIKANIPSRIAFAVSSQIDSRTILDMGGAEKLLGKGDMLFLPMGASKPTRIQGSFISDKEVNRIVDFVKNPDVQYDEDVIEKIESGVSGESEPDGGDADELLPKAVEIVVEAQQASASLLQRRLKVGYSRAGRLIDQLEARGIIGPHEGAKPRAVLITRAQLAEMQMQNPEA
ncbi:MAG: DNA translocase FtsK [Clostridia bacterium]|nr:DNA translocase FtsK [Clostridia bacterium]